jgi:O-antigen/teichoic acid export membrane protein
LARGADGEKRLVLRALGLRAGASAVAAATIWALAPLLAARLLHDPAQAGLIRLVAVLLVAMGLGTLMTSVLVTRYEQKFINLIQVLVTASYLGATAVVVSLGGGVTGALACLIGMHGFTGLLFLVRWIVRRPRAPRSDSDDAGPSLGALLRFSGFAYVYNALLFVFQKGMDVMLLGLLLTDLAPVTWYVIAYNFVFHAVSFFSNAFSEGFSLAMISEVAARRDMEKLRRIFTVAVEYLYLFVLPILVGGVLVGGDILRLLYPASTAAGALAPMIVLLAALSLSKIGSLTPHFLFGMDRQRTLVAVRIVFGVVNFVGDWLLIPRYHALGAAMGTGIAVVGGIATEWWIVHRLLRPEYPWRFLGKVVVASLAMVPVLLPLRLLNWPLPVKVPLLLLAGMTAFAGALAVLRPLRREHEILLATLPLPGKRFWLPRLIGPTRPGERRR